MAKPKPLEKMIQTGYRITEQKKKEIEDIAELRGQSVQSLIDEAVDLRLGITEGFYDQLKLVADKLKLPLATVFSNMIIKQAAFNFAWVQVFGTAHPRAFKEFRFAGEGLLTGEPLSEVMVKEYVEILEKLESKTKDIQETEEPYYHFSTEEMSALLGAI